jgi:hypothetical protein
VPDFVPNHDALGGSMFELLVGNAGTMPVTAGYRRSRKKWYFLPDEQSLSQQFDYSDNADDYDGGSQNSWRSLSTYSRAHLPANGSAYRNEQYSRPVYGHHKRVYDCGNGIVYGKKYISECVHFLQALDHENRHE